MGAGGGEHVPLAAPFALNLNGPAITVSSRLGGIVGGDRTAAGVARLVARRREEGASPITFAVVFPFSVHSYLLRDWLAREGIDPDRDIRLAIAPPARMTGLLVDGVVEGFCVTEPWDTAAVAAGAGVIVARSAELWPRTPDKVFAVTERFAEAHPERLRAVLRALARAAAWADAPEHRPELAAILARPQYVAANVGVIERSLAGMVFHAEGANAPVPAHAGWLLGQMLRWGHAPADLDIPAVARRVYRPDLHAHAVTSLGLAAPAIPAALPLYGSVEQARHDAAAAPLSRIAAD
jgi:NitT/TauT family transport system ATP-binding protein/nitrate/nitrite transport system substrate-binding protein